MLSISKRRNTVSCCSFSPARARTRRTRIAAEQRSRDEGLRVPTKAREAKGTSGPVGRFGRPDRLPARVRSDGVRMRQSGQEDAVLLLQQVPTSSTAGQHIASRKVCVLQSWVCFALPPACAWSVASRRDMRSTQPSSRSANAGLTMNDSGSA